MVRKTVVDDDKIDIYGYTIQNGSEYIKGYYLEKAKETKRKVFYKQLNKSMFILVKYFVQQCLSFFM